MEAHEESVVGFPVGHWSGSSYGCTKFVEKEVATVVPVVGDT